MTRREITIVAPFNNLGYGHASYNIAKQLDKISNLHIHPIGRPEQSDRFIQHAISRPWDKNATCVRIFHQHSLKEFIGKGKHIGFPIFELDTFTDQEKHHLNSVDELFVCSQWAKDVCRANDITVPVHVVPLGVDTGIFNPSRNAPSSGRTVFLNVGKWEVRKGHPELARAFHSAFKPGDPVELWLMCDNPFYPPELTAQFHRMFTDGPMGGQVKFIPRVENHAQVAKIMGRATCGVFPAKAEGWNLELLEMMAIGKPVITTDYSGHTEFSNVENSYLLHGGKMEPANDGVWFKGQGNWRSIEVDELIDLMRHVRTFGNNLGVNDEGIKTAQQFSWENTAKKIYDLC